jgi:hypothetical protein
MRWISTKESVQNGEISVLAVIETVLAVSVSLFLAIWYQTVWHILLGACISPLLLLRTDRSAAKGVAYYDGLEASSVGKFYDSVVDYRASSIWAGVLQFLLIVGVMIPTLSLALLAIRGFATLQSAVKHPLEAFRAIPDNWRRVCLSIDSRHSPVFLPAPLHGPQTNLGTLYELFEDRIQSKDRRELFTVALLLIVLAPVLMPPMLYRWSLKATAVIWFPLLWAVRPVGKQEHDLRTRLSLLKDSELFFVVRVVSVAALVAFLAKIYVHVEVSAFARWWNAQAFGKLLTIYVQPGEIPIWQAAIAVNSALAMGIWFFIRAALRRIELDVPWSQRRVEGVLSATLAMRRVLTTYTIICLFYVYGRAACTWDWPPLGSKLFPW